MKLKALLIRMSWIVLLTATVAAESRPNIILIMADDLGFGDLGCYGQTKIQTPHIDRLASEGMRFTQFYSGNPVCAPSRCALMTGVHSGHAFIRNNRGMKTADPASKEGQWPLRDEAVTLGELMQEQGYVTGIVGKWGLGGPDTSGEPNRQGFDFFFGYLCQSLAHNYYPAYLWRNTQQQALAKNGSFSAHQRLDKLPAERDFHHAYQGKEYAPDLMADEALKFINDNKDQPFFLYFAPIVPHLALQVPDDSLEMYRGKFEDRPYLGDRGYLPHPHPRAAYAAMITRMDRDIGRLQKLLDELGIGDNTLLLFTSDNGATYTGGADTDFFQSTGKLRGKKGSCYEGGVRVPLLARWPGKIRRGTVTSHAAANWDVLPTVLDILNVAPPAGIDGISFSPTILESGVQRRHDVLYWELGKQQGVRAGKWKLVRTSVPKPKEFQEELFDLESDPGEQRNLKESHSKDLQRMLVVARQARTKNEDFPSPFDQGQPGNGE